MPFTHHGDIAGALDQRFPSGRQLLILDNGMLCRLELKNFAVVDELQLDLGPGLNVLTGETGAGKSILVDALSLLIGARADSALVRTGHDSALIQGTFSGNHAVESLARRLTSGGRSTARLNGEIVTVHELARTTRDYIAIHGQHAFQTLLDPGEQLRLLDTNLPDEAQAALGRYLKEFAAYQRVNQALTTLAQSARDRAQRIDMLNYQIDEIDQAQLGPNEEEGLELEARSLRNAERIAQGAGLTAQLLSGDERGAVQSLSQALRELQGTARYHPQLEPLAHDLEAAVTGAQAVAQEVEVFLADFEADPARLEAIEGRLALIQRLGAKYGSGTDEILAYRREIGRELDQLAGAQSDAHQLGQQRDELEARLSELAEQLTLARQAAARQLAAGVTELARPLAMENAVFDVEVTPHSELGPSGHDRVAFTFSANLGEPPRPLADVASGGELSRVMLALNVATGADAPILVFDEVDAGLGGRTARRVGKLLKRLARTHQVLVVTHLAQVAAYADHQIYVEKLEVDGRTSTAARPLSRDEREAELARMLSGAVTDKALAHARELLQSARPSES